MSTTNPNRQVYPAPDGVLIGHLTPGTAAWDEARDGLTITATEIAAVVGLSPWMSKFTLWHKKSGLQTPPFEMTPAIEWGNRLEDAVAIKWEDEHPDYMTAPAGTWHHRGRDWQRATPDRLIYEQPAGEFEIPDNAIALLEVKTSPFGDEWGAVDFPDAVPIHYRCQVMWQMDTLGLKRTHFAVLISGHDYREYTVDYDETEAKILRDAAARFLDDVRRGVRPPIDSADDTYRTIRVQPDHFDDIDVQIPAEDADRYHAAHLAAKAADAELTAAKGVVLDHIGPGRRAVVGDRRIAYRIAKADGTTKSLTPYKQKDAA